MDSVEVVTLDSPFLNLAALYEVDPDADVLLTVPPPNQVFAPWNEPPQKDDGVNRGNINSPGTAAAAPLSRPGLRIKVSSRHLELASRVFRNKLQFGGSKAARQSDGRVHLKLAEQFDPQAVCIVMDAIHGRGSKVPKSVDVETLAQVALLVDRFHVFDAVEVYAERWISKLEDTIPRAYNRDLVLWLYISYVFRHSGIFKVVTKLAAAQSPGPIKTLGLPIREKIIKHIDEQRQTLLAQAITILHQTLDDLSSNSVPCAAQNCDALLLGELIKALQKQRLLPVVWPSLPPPPSGKDKPSFFFPGVSFAVLVDAVRDGIRLIYEEPHGLGPCEKKKKGSDNENVAAPSHQLNVLGISSERLPATPAASPEPVEVDRFPPPLAHECDARTAVWRLDGLKDLGEGVQGLVLVSGLGYRLY
ncbi:uncharacterized protein B0T15DRAFT_405605 [Chaetomium strumarium]|uniref:BTB domain-containing protein n=1 Tax=Chaetomium strumarium TaxID=1170767 RepID=A0AAJ0H057_9PEZI|nr:hypothetical protein B0T15DRAFT_405605 [Chaetomium strumarium]